ncbi:hypothetical protein [Erythrobacter crassostreae]|uniref:Uncharacterized protein n=1 Tax=Erythrobacter crassostreae TaxID=2828328 RepID=A0A9X1JN08_9SPHN|nr:hypothetical protein [Erythrobacter crassostrea]MBV7259974.1 hypothetical protein [Erythrobacter crassostrea]
MKLFAQYSSKSKLIVALLGGASLLASCSAETEVDGEASGDVSFCTSPAPMPAGYGYPVSETEVAEWVANRDEQAAREHGWKLFAGLQSEAGDGWVWRSWCTETQAFAMTGDDPSDSNGTGKQAMLAAQSEAPMRAFKLDNGLTSGEEPINFEDAPKYAVPQPVLDKYSNSECLVNKPNQPVSLANGPTFQNNGDILIAGVIYNASAFGWIRDTKIYDASVLQGMRPASDMTKQIDPFPSEAIALKPMLWPIKGAGYTAVPVWDDLSEDYGRYSGFEIQSQWPRAVAVTTSINSDGPVTVTMLEQEGVTQTVGGVAKRLGPNVYDDAQQVSVDDFYSFTPDLGTIDQCDNALLDRSAYYAFGRMFEQGDMLALVAMHIQTKEQPDWTFQSIWWSDQPNDGPYAADRPNIPEASGPWQNYLMASTYGWPEVEGGSTWPIAYNPYIELAAAHPIKTNCLNCHQRASFPGQPDSYLQTGGPGALDVFTYEGNEIFAGLIGTDSLWSISDRAICPDGTKPPCKTE